MELTQSGGSTKLGRESRSKRLGVKISDGSKVMTGQVIIRQRGTKYIAGKNILTGGDDTLFAKKDGIVKFATKTKKRFDGRIRRATEVNVR
jgi:large subunit ribosomal protein L27